MDFKFVWKDDPWKPNALGDYFIFDNNRNKKVYDKIALTEINGEILPFYLNRFAERYMSPGIIDFTTGVTQHPTMWCNLSIKPSDYQVAKTATYVYGFEGEFQNVLSNPINGKLDPRMFFFWTYAGDYAGENNTITIEGV